MEVCDVWLELVELSVVIDVLLVSVELLEV